MGFPWVLAVGLAVVGCRSERKDIVNLCRAFNETLGENHGDGKLKSKIETIILRTDSAKRIREDLMIENVTKRLTGITALARKAREHKLDGECTAALQVAEIAEAISAALKEGKKPQSAAPGTNPPP